MNKSAFFALIIIFCLLVLTRFSFGEEEDPVLKNLQQQKNRIMTDYERAAKKLEAIETMEAKQKEYLEIIQQEKTRQDLLNAQKGKKE